MSDLASAVLLSLRVAISATLLVTIIGVPLAHVFARRKFLGKAVLETILTVPLVLPPTVVGYILIVLMGRHSLLGKLIEWISGSTLLFTVSGAVIASTVVAMPLLYLPAKAAFAGVEPEMEDLARLLGANRLQVFWYVSLPMATRGIGSGVLLAFARALGEFGATVMVLGVLPGKQTLPISIYLDFEGDRLSHATPTVALLTAISFLVILAYNRTLGSASAFH